LTVDFSRLLDQFKYNPEEPLLFNTGFFLFLFTAFIATYALLHKTHRAKLTFVTLFSLYFYYKSSGVYFLILIGSTVIDFFLARWIAASESKWTRKLAIIITLLINLGMLGYFKYTNFFYESFFYTGDNFQPLDIFLPVGVSFFTFQSLSYTIDVYRGNIKPVSHILDYAFFVTFFPQLVAGPIVRAADFLPQINKHTIVTKEMLGRAVFLIGCGLFKKAVISDYISINFIDRVFDAPALYSGTENLLAVYGYALQIYCDFSGYSDMAIGIALLLGFHFPLNFNAPYQSINITEFWRRWHISLSTWLRDYLYISLGGNRKGKVRSYINQMITMLLGGLWHGPSWLFIIWGALHGAALAVHKMFRSIFMKEDSPGKQSGFWSTLFFGLLTFHFVCFCWIFFRATSLENAFQVIQQVQSGININLMADWVGAYRYVAFLMLLGYILHFVPSGVEDKLRSVITKSSLVWKAAFLFAIILVVIQTKSSGIQPFIYFQF